MNKYFYRALLLAVFFSEPAFSQTIPSKQWDVRYGGSGNDTLTSFLLLSDGTFLIGGFSDSPVGGTVSLSPKGGLDYWVVKCDMNGNKLSEMRFGGNKNDYLQQIIAVPDGGFLLAGYSNTDLNGDLSQSCRGGYDYWIIKTDDEGNKQWDARFGGTGNDYLQSAECLSGGGFLLSGYSDSGAGEDKSQPSYGADDYWVIKTNEFGVMQWDAHYGGCSDDHLTGTSQLHDGRYFIAGYTHSPKSCAGDITDKGRGSKDFWILMTDSSAGMQWSERYGGDARDIMKDILKTPEGDFLLAGISASGVSDEQTNPSRGSDDYWLMKVDETGLIRWDRRYGGNKIDVLKCIDVTGEGGIVLGGYSESDSTGEQTSACIGQRDFWLVKTDRDGLVQYDIRLGGTKDDEINRLGQTTDGGFLLCGDTKSGETGDLSELSYGGVDFWIVKLSPALVSWYEDADGDGFGNPGSVTSAFTKPPGYTGDNSDCNDAAAAINPSEIEICNTVDDNCDGLTDTEDPSVVSAEFFYDLDGDGYGSGQGTVTCTPLENQVPNNDDCNDADEGIHPLADEICNSIDDDCDGLMDEEALDITIVATGPTSFCFGESVILQAPANPNYSYSWKKDGNFVGNSNGSSYEAKNSGSYSVKVSSGLCTTTSDAITVTEFDDFTALVSPSADVTSCKGIPIELSASGGGTGSSYQWLKGTDAINGATGKKYQVPAESGGNYKVIITNSSGCTSTSDAVQVTRLTTPDATITVTKPADDPDLCDLGYVKLKSSGSTSTTYQWRKDGQLINGATNKEYEATAEGNFKVEVTNISTGCSRLSDATTVYSSCRLNQAQDDGDIEVFPNPVSGELTISIPPEYQEGKVILQIANMFGQIVFNEIVPVGEDDKIRVMTKPEWSDGVYVIYLVSDELISASKFILQKE